MTARTVLRPPSRQNKERAPLGPYGRVGKAVEELDERLGLAKGGKTFLNKIFPDHWSFMLGEIALYSFIILLATGVFLTLYYIPSSTLVVYNGPVQAARRPAHVRGVQLDDEPVASPSAPVS